MAIVRGRGVVEQIDQESRSSSAHDLLSSRSVSASSSTPPTTIESDIPPCQKPTPDTNITNIDQGHEAGESRRRSVRERHTLTSYNLNVLSGTAKHGVRKSVSGATLVNPSQAEDQLQPLNDNHALLNGNEMSGPLASLGRSERERRPSRRNTVIGAVSDIASSLGKRARDVVENSNSLSVLRRMSSRSGQRTHFYDQDGTEHDTSRAKRSRLSHADNLVSSSASSEIVELTAPEPKRKMWQEHGLYAGQVRLYEPNFDHPTYRGGQQPKLLESPGKERKYLPMPMFVGELKIRQGQDFRLPYDVLSLLPYEAKPKDGWVLKETVPKSRYMGYAAEYKLIDHHGQSFCRCTLASGCAEDCMNRTMHFECDDNNCNVGAQHCQNRQFAVLSRPRRLNAFERGVEVMETKDRGFGVRSVRSYRPHEIIIEYTGDIITQEEADRRMNQEYKDHKNFYMMTLQENLIIDAGGKKGSIARFVNHSCDPNCYMDRWTVRGEERIALFAGDFGISTGDELTYDYKFR
ncbi:SET domain-containing protein [Eremomyces bilateralis CBS 781.70]|uniref:SET domain-containing protein n=1 Tax=Eremomyces bilateralis CBS 781.70 TaxID=1392243 RepID=A0A6G1G8W5_9PEZI|nr:SET domain-containing protein [Eremomyces bilateralis CBS 781.70]KAF1814518.1 SET domain-containing protein [Eremomyces bilateralis CBS 781.70]